MSVYGGPNIVNDNLIMNLDMANKKSYPGAGTTWRDLIGNGYVGTLINGPAYSSEKQGGIVLSAASSQYINVSPIPKLTSSYSIEMWMKMPSSINTDLDLLALTSANHGLLFELSSTANVRFLHRYPYGISGGDDAQTTSALSLSTIYCLTITRDSKQRIYINDSLAKEINSTVGNFDTNLSGLVFGRLGTDYALRYFNGTIFSVRFYGKALSTSEVLRNYNATKARFGL